MNFRFANAAMALILLVAGSVAVRSEEVSWPELSSPARSVGGGEHDAAVIVGVERYAFVASVPGAKSNAKEWYEYLTETRGVPAQNVKLLTDEDGAKEQILDAARVAASRVSVGGTLWFVFVGHGAPATDGKDGLLVGMDARQTAESLQQRSVRRRELLALLTTSKATAISVILDSCFSGRGQDGAAIATGLQPMVTVAGAGAVDPRMTVLTAAKGDQFAGALPGAKRPAFSYLVLGGLRGWAADKDGKITAGSLWRYATNALEATLRGRKQEPDILGKQGTVLATTAGEKGPNLAKLALATAGGTASAEISKGSSQDQRPAVLAGSVAEVNGVSVLLSEYQKEAAKAREYWDKANPSAMTDPENRRKLRESTLEQLIDRELLFQEGVKLKLQISEREIDNAVGEIKARFRKDERGNNLSESEADKAFADELNGEGLTYVQFRARLSRQIGARKVIEIGVARGKNENWEAETEAYLKTLRDKAVIIRHLPPS